MTEDDQRNLGLELHCVEGDMCSYNRCVARELGSVEAAIMLSHLFEQYASHKHLDDFLRHKKHPGDWFCYTVQDCTEDTGLTRKQQSSALKALENLNLFENCGLGSPAKRHFKLDASVLKELESLKRQRRS
jgi:hypothetical protein